MILLDKYKKNLSLLLILVIIFLITFLFLNKNVRRKANIKIINFYDYYIFRLMHKLDKKIYKNIILSYNPINNNEYKYHSLNKPENVVLFYSHNFDELPGYALKSIELSEKYCKIHNYKLIVFKHNKEEMSSYWLRVKDLYDLSNKYNEKSIFIYLDLDACINPLFFNMPIDRFLLGLKNHKYKNKIYDIYTAKDLGNIINTGCIILRNTQWSKNLLRYYLSLYNTDKWIYKNNNWRCYQITELNIPCMWARQYYEQGELNTIYKNNIMNSKDHIGVVDTGILCNVFRNTDPIPNIPYTFVYHLFGDTKKNGIAEDFFTNLQYYYNV